MLTLYDYYRSSACYRVRIALHLKQLKFNVVPIHLVNNGGEQFSSAYQAINPQSLVPTLKNNDQVISQSLAIISYLEDLYPEPALLPKDAFERTLVKEFALIIAADIHPLNNQRILKYLTNNLQITEADKNTWYHHWLKLGLATLEKKMLTHKLFADFCFGDKPTLADICLVPQLYNAKRFACDLTAYPTLVKIDANCQKHPAFKAAFPQEKDH